MVALGALAGLVVVVLRGAWAVVRQGNFIGGVVSSMGDASGTEEGGVRGAQGDHDTWHVHTGRGDGSSSRMVAGAVRATASHPAGTRPSGPGVSSGTPWTPVQPLHCSGWSAGSGAGMWSAGHGGSSCSGGSSRMPTGSEGSVGRAGAGGGGSATTLVYSEIVSFFPFLHLFFQLL